MASGRRLIVNADDFGFARGVNAGIVDAHRRGILTATTLMANGAAFEDAVRLAREVPSLDVGCHLVLVQGESVLNPGKPLPATPVELLKAVATGSLPVRDELAAQVRRILDAGVRPTHIDTHKHTHVLPPVLDAVASVAKEFGILWVRQPFDIRSRETAGGAPLSTRLTAAALRALRPRFRDVLSRHGLRGTDHFAGFQLTGRFGAAELIRLFGSLPPGTTEFMCHPGYRTEELDHATTRLKQSRESELNALMAPETRQSLYDTGVELISYRDLPVLP